MIFSRCELNHGILESLVKNRDEIYGVSGDVMPQLLGGRVGVQILQIEVQPVLSEEKHVIQSLAVYLGLGQG